MRKAIFTLILILGVVAFAKGQSSINDYKYVIVPNKYDFLKSEDQYQLNSLTKFLFNKYGFTALMKNENYPEDLIKNSCLALNSNVINNSSLFSTKLVVELRNCKGELVYISQIGKTREKNLSKAFNLALRMAFESFSGLNYLYTSSKQDSLGNKTYSSQKKEIQAFKKEKNTLKKTVKPIIEKSEQRKTKKLKEILHEILYAQKTSYGYQVVDSNPKVVMILLDTDLIDVFLVKDKNAIVYKQDGLWYLTEYDNMKYKTITIHIKF